MEQAVGPTISCPLGNLECPLSMEIERLQKECERLSELAQVDSLTRLFNYRYLVSALEQEMERTRRTGLSTSLIMVDLDCFKAVNDTYGHQVGNQTLILVARMFRKSLRRIDIPCRFGGEEFAIILPGTRLPQAMRTAERLRALLAESKFDAEGQPVRLTASFGVDTYSAEEQLAADDFIKRADQLLLEAKAEGRNRVCQRSLEAAEPLTEITAEERAMLYVSQRASKEP